MYSSSTTRRVLYEGTKAYCDGQINFTINKRFPELVKKIEEIRSKRDQLRKQRSKQTRKIAYIEGEEYEKGDWFAPDDPSLELKGYIESDDGERFYVPAEANRRRALHLLDEAIEALEKEHDVLDQNFDAIGKRADFFEGAMKRLRQK